jgi:hypothetical protein
MFKILCLSLLILFSSFIQAQGGNLIPADRKEQWFAISTVAEFEQFIQNNRLDQFLNLQDNHGNTLAHCFIFNPSSPGRISVFAKLFEAGANFEIENNSNQTIITRSELIARLTNMRQFETIIAAGRAHAVEQAQRITNNENWRNLPAEWTSPSAHSEEPVQEPNRARVISHRDTSSNRIETKKEESFFTKKNMVVAFIAALGLYGVLRIIQKPKKDDKKQVENS